MKKLFFLVFLLFLWANAFTQCKKSVSYAISYVSTQYDLFHSLGLGITKNKMSFNQEVGLSHKYLVINEYNWRIQEQFYYTLPINKRISFDAGLAFGFISRWRSSTFFQLEENLIFSLHVKTIVSYFWRNSIGVMHQMNGNAQLYYEPNVVSQIGVSYVF